MRRVATGLVLALGLAGCAGVGMGEHVAAKDLPDQPKRLFVVNRLDTQFHGTIRQDFARAIVPALERCRTTARVFDANPLELNAEDKFKAALETFKPDGILNIVQRRRNLMDGEVRGGSYQVVLYSPVQKRDLWKAAIGTGASARFLADRSVVGPRFADEIVRTMAADGVLKECPPFPPRPTED